jgi:hypothetical protein
MTEGFTADPVTMARLGLKSADLAERLVEARMTAGSQVDGRSPLAPSTESLGDEQDLHELSEPYLAGFVKGYGACTAEAIDALTRLARIMGEDADGVLRAAFRYQDLQDRSVDGFKRVLSR